MRLIAITVVAVIALCIAASHAEEVAIAPMALNSLSTTPANIANAPVMNQSGEVIGKVQRVVRDQDGKPAAISYVGKDGKLVVVAAPAVSYDGQKHLLVTEDATQRVASR
jgi:hypothetical protein